MFLSLGVLQNIWTGACLTTTLIIWMNEPLQKEKYLSNTFLGEFDELDILGG